MFTKAYPCTYPESNKPSTHTTCLFWDKPSILTSHLCLCLLNHLLHSGFQTNSKEISQLSYCITHIYTGHIIFIQLLIIIIVSNEHKLWKFICHILNLLNILCDLDVQQHCWHLKSHTVEDSFQDFYIGCYCEGEQHFKPISFKWHAPLSYNEVVTKTEHISVHLYYDARVRTQKPAEQMGWTSDSQSHLTTCMGIKWSDALQGVVLTPWNHDLNGNSPTLHTTFFSLTI